jgi:urease accessory protein
MSNASTNSRIRAAALITGLLLSAPVLAHTGSEHAIGLVSGFMHPLTGFDHLLAMLAVGIWAAQQRNSARWALPMLFPAIMVPGAMLGMTAVQLPGIEPGIAGSVAVLGLLIAFAIKMPLWGGVAVALFATVHGYARGTEVPADVSPLLYGVGFIVATFALHVTGLLIGVAAAGQAAAKIVRVLGGAIAATGAFLLVGAA